MTQRTVAIYLRVSTGEQTIDNQRRELLAAAERRGWQVVAEFSDEGISGANGRDKRPGFDRLCRAIVRHQFDIVAAWSVDRLGRSLQDLVAFLGELHGAGVDLYLDRQGLDTSTPFSEVPSEVLVGSGNWLQVIDFVDFVFAGISAGKNRPVSEPETHPIGFPFPVFRFRNPWRVLINQQKAVATGRLEIVSIPA